MILLLAVAALLTLAEPPHHAGELPVDPYVVSNVNAGAKPVADEDLYLTFGGPEGLARIADGLVSRAMTDPRTEKIFAAVDQVRLKRTLTEQFCYLLNGPCDYTGRDMASVHKDHGLTTADFNAIVEHLQAAMDEEGVPFFAQNRLLARLAPMHREIVTR